MDLIDALQKLRDIVGPIIVNDGFRCFSHNSDVKGQKNSYHMLGMAADIRHGTRTSADLASVATVIPRFTTGGIGMYPTFIHVDIRGHRARWKG